MYLAVHLGRDADPARLGQALEPRGDVDTVSIEALPLNAHVAQVRTDAELHPSVRGQPGVASREHPLDLDCALDGVQGGGEPVKSTSRPRWSPTRPSISWR